MRFVYILLLALCSIGFTTVAQQSKKTNKRAKADAGSVAPSITITSIKSKFLLKDTTHVVIFLQINAQKSNDAPLSLKEFIQTFNLNYVIYPDFSSRERLGYGNIALNEQNLVQLRPNQFMANFEIKRPVGPPSAVLLSELSEIGTTKKVLNDLTLRFKNPKLSDELTLYEHHNNFPLLRNYINVKDTIWLKGINTPSRQLYVKRYQHDFDAASSPMNTSPRSTQRSLQVDTVFTINTANPVIFLTEGLYYIVADTTDMYGIGVVVANKRFPRLTRPEELIKPVMYMSQNHEIAELSNNQNAKKALDRYWLGLMNGNVDLAKQTISAFYTRVSEANRLFTTYKEGWKTDKGLIFIIMGEPDRIQRSKDKEVWVYTQKGNYQEINFTFNKRPNQFVEDHYELQRYVEYQPIWYPMVEAWRTGAIRE